MAPAKKSDGPPSFVRLPNLASLDVGAKVLFATDDFFQVAESMLKSDEPVFNDEYTEFGKWMDGWETRRKRIAGHDWCIVALGLPGGIEGFEFDTAHFTGNQVPRASVQGIYIAPEDLPTLPARKSVMGSAATEEDIKAVEALGSDKWPELLAQVDLKPGYPETRHNYFEAEKVGKVSHLRINLFPDGGIARFRVHGVVDKDWSKVADDEEIDLVRVENGGLVLEVSDSHYGHPSRLLLSVPPKNMSSGWETSTYLRASLKQHTVIKLGHPGLVEKVVLDTSWFKGNFPESVVVEAAFLPAGKTPNDRTTWHPLLPRARLGPHAAHSFAASEGKLENADKPVSHVKLTMFPDGGIARFNVVGKVFRGPLPEPEPEESEDEEKAAKGKRKAKEDTTGGRKSARRR
ncbi:allantoicase-like protein [Gonapodya prolifera JEL478]|uniref:Allantoicase-like protein n=1 Tax=Gonapodya prolifera (strain JEL478) TaxID=1344416 RepID=A0A139AGL5_GONPJ|nr:allantoicase-like protein [Gonapodya prolifera JEL478]|eukprot:KXS15888.1 allantoicase-like protein [Gonapodya prolifera JEL478]